MEGTVVAKRPARAAPSPPAARERQSVRGRRAGASLRALLRTSAPALLCAAAASSLFAEDGARQELRSLDEQVQEAKSDVLAIATELDRLEERLLFPSNTQVALFVSLGEGETFRLDSVQIQIDGVPVARHVYSFKELEALQKGGVQRIYTGNVATGEHRVDVVVAGKSASGEDFSGSQSFGFSKGIEPKLVEISLAGGNSGSASIQLGSR